ncbi:MAG: GNAT family N-acetyltransferase [Gammaproteobacteria bacterium]|nr:GNAT family N-acetyltransferase [Gammaproteobacteria bacterium]
MAKAIHVFVYSLVVDPACQGRGIARGLLEAAEQAAAAKGCITMRLEVRADNEAAIRLYCKAGYRTGESTIITTMEWPRSGCANPLPLPTIPRNPHGHFRDQ